MAIMVQTGIALAVAAVPEGLPVVATLSLARGMWRMSQRNAIITRLSSVETLGATTVILTDKTGTLTENRMTVVRYLLSAGDVDIERDDGQAEAGPDSPLCWALRIRAFCNNAELGEGEKETHTGDPMEIALLSVADDLGMSRDTALRDYPELLKYAIDPLTKMVATAHRTPDGFLFAVKGAPEAVTSACTKVLTGDGAQALTEDRRDDWMDRSTSAAHDGLRLVAFAMKEDPATDANPFDDLILVGIVCLLDPVREDVPEAIRACRAAGVRVVMLTGDHAQTAATIAREASLSVGEMTVIEGCALASLDAQTVTDEDRARILSADVFARVEPETKLTLVKLFQDAGHVVAMTGDGVNDAPALKKADIGIAMGKRGTQVAREAAHMVLRDDAFASIVEAMRQGGRSSRTSGNSSSI